MDTLFFVLSKSLRLAIQLESWVVLAVVLGIVASLRRRRRAAIGWNALALILLLVGGFPLVGRALMAPLEADHPPVQDLARVDGIIVLGGMVNHWGTARHRQLQLNPSGERFLAGAQLALAHPEARLILSGWTGRRPKVGKETTRDPIRLAALTDLGIDESRIQFDRMSRNTAENATFSKTLADPAPGETWVVVTSAWHMERALQSFETAGWPGITPYPVDYATPKLNWRWDFANNARLFNKALKEHIGRQVYRWTGR